MLKKMCAPIAVNTASTITVAQATLISQIMGLSIISGVIVTGFKDRLFPKLLNIFRRKL